MYQVRGTSSRSVLRIVIHGVLVTVLNQSRASFTQNVNSQLYEV